MNNIDTEKSTGKISRYYQKQYERFIKASETARIKEAFFESVSGPKYEDDTLYTRFKRNPRKKSIN